MTHRDSMAGAQAGRRVAAQRAEALRAVQHDLSTNAQRLVTRLARPGSRVLEDKSAFNRMCRLGMARRAMMETADGVAVPEAERNDMVLMIDAELHALLGRNPESEAMSEHERSHLLDLACGYGMSVRYCRILMRYHAGQSRGREAREDDGAAFTSDDRMRASMED